MTIEKRGMLMQINKNRNYTKLNLILVMILLISFAFLASSCSKDEDNTEAADTGDENSDIDPELLDVVDYANSCQQVTGLIFSPVSYLAEPDYSEGYSVCQDECIDLDTDEGTWNAYDIYTGDDWCSDLNKNTENSTYTHCCAYCFPETHYSPISKSCEQDSNLEQGLQWELECPYITLSWDKDEKAISYEIIPFYDENKDGTEDGKCEEDISNTKERYFYYNLESSDCAAYYTGNVRFQIIPQYSDSLSIDSYNTDWIDVTKCNIGEDSLDYILLDVPYVKQSKEYWCLCASTAMVLQYYGMDITQAEIANNIINQGGGSEILLVFWINKIGFDPFVFDMNIENIKYALRKGYPLMIFQRYSLDCELNHARVIVGYNDNKKVLIVHDPWSYGKNHEMSYSLFLNLCNDFNDLNLIGVDHDLCHIFLIAPLYKGILDISNFGIPSELKLPPIETFIH